MDDYCEHLPVPPWITGAVGGPQTNHLRALRFHLERLSTRINHVVNDDAECCVPVELAQAQARLFTLYRADSLSRANSQADSGAEGYQNSHQKLITIGSIFHLSVSSCFLAAGGPDLNKRKLVLGCPAPSGFFAKGGCLAGISRSSASRTCRDLAKRASKPASRFNRIDGNLAKRLLFINATLAH